MKEKYTAYEVCEQLAEDFAGGALSYYIEDMVPPDGDDTDNVATMHVTIAGVEYSVTVSKRL